ncbi:MAG: hypothetical protein ACYS47_14265 [Planctomycetota bacterium]|jgi:hypothetical protein
MERLIWPISITLCLFLAAGGVSFAEPEEASLTEFMDLGALLKGTPFEGVRSLEGLAPVLQDDDWGWGEEEKKDEEEAPPEEPGGGEGEGWGWGDEGGGKEEGGGEGDGWGWGGEGGEKGAEKPPAESPGGGEGGGEWGDEWEDEPEDIEPVDPGPGELPDRGPRGNVARKTRIGIDGGIFLPFGQKEEEFTTSGIGGIFLGFGLPPFLGSLTVTSEIHLQGGVTSSEGQTGGFDVSTTLLLGKFDLLFHFMPTNPKFNLYYFLGLAVGFEMSKADPSSGTGTGETGNYPGFLIDTGLGAWLNLGGPVDLILKLEFNFIPMSENVPFFVTGGMGLQVKF